MRRIWIREVVFGIVLLDLREVFEENLLSSVMLGLVRKSFVELDFEGGPPLSGR